MGILFSFAASALFSLSFITTRQGVRRLGVWASTGVMLISGTIITTLMALLLEGTGPLAAASLRGFLFFGAAGVIHFCLGWIFVNNASLRIGATRVGAIMSVTPLFAALIAFFTLKQTINPVSLGGILLITIGIYTIATSKD